jgi:hypothetical protein
MGSQATFRENQRETSRGLTFHYRGAPLSYLEYSHSIERERAGLGQVELGASNIIPWTCDI